jgi:hypothetical protein
VSSPNRDPLHAIEQLPGVFEGVEAARGSVDALLRDLRSAALRRRTSSVTSEALRRSAWASAMLESSPGTAPVGLDDFAPPFPDTAGGRLAAGSLRVSGELMRLATTWGRAPGQALARLHSLAGSGSVPDEDLGRPRSAAHVSDRLVGLAALVTAPTEAAAVVVASVVLAELMVIEPFESLNGVVARGAARLVLVERGLDPVAATVPEEGLLELRRRGTTALDGYRSGTSEGVAGWVVHYAQAVALGGRVGRGIARGVQVTSQADG